MPSLVKSTIALFADDAYLLKSISSQHDVDILQGDLNILQTWEGKWSMEFHPEKCQLLRLTNKRKTVEAHYTIHGKRLKLVEKAKYLGVTLSKNLSWKYHVYNNITAKANSTRLFLQRNLVKVDRKLKLKCYNTYVRPILEYASSVWSPVNQISLIRKIEMVQHKAVRWICSNWDREASVSNMEASLCMKKLENRRSIAQLKMMRDLITGD